MLFSLMIMTSFCSVLIAGLYNDLLETSSQVTSVENTAEHGCVSDQPLITLPIEHPPNSKNEFSQNKPTIIPSESITPTEKSLTDEEDSDMMAQWTTQLSQYLSTRYKTRQSQMGKQLNKPHEPLKEFIARQKGWDKKAQWTSDLDVLISQLVQEKLRPWNNQRRATSA